jgi:hypothetical protein
MQIPLLRRIVSHFNRRILPVKVHGGWLNLPDVVDFNHLFMLLTLCKLLRFSKIRNGPSNVYKAGEVCFAKPLRCWLRLQ